MTATERFMMAHTNRRAHACKATGCVSGLGENGSSADEESSHADDGIVVTVIERDDCLLKHRLATVPRQGYRYDPLGTGSTLNSSTHRSAWPRLSGAIAGQP
ncbi:hypothetical protein KAR02_09470 [Candidatus Bipolaricaulota bacterium]|nr:hypothetical protein [Candidatus Bipolaricaulota bacterium]